MNFNPCGNTGVELTRNVPDEGFIFLQMQILKCLAKHRVVINIQRLQAIRNSFLILKTTSVSSGWIFGGFSDEEKSLCVKYLLSPIPPFVIILDFHRRTEVPIMIISLQNCLKTVMNNCSITLKVFLSVATPCAFIVCCEIMWNGPWRSKVRNTPWELPLFALYFLCCFHTPLGFTKYFWRLFQVLCVFPGTVLVNISLRGWKRHKHFFQNHS